MGKSARTALTSSPFNKYLLQNAECFLINAFLELRNKIKGDMTFILLYFYLHVSHSQLPFSRVLQKALDLSFASTPTTVSTNTCLGKAEGLFLESPEERAWLLSSCYKELNLLWLCSLHVFHVILTSKCILGLQFQFISIFKPINTIMWFPTTLSQN